MSKKIAPEILLKAIQTISTTLASEISLEEAFGRCLQEAIDAVGATFGSIMAWGPKVITMSNTYKIHKDYIPKLFVKGFLAMGTSPSEIALSTGKYYMMENVFTDYRFRFGMPLGREAGYSSLIYIPIVIKNRILGTIVAYTKELHTFTQEEIHFLGAVAEQAAITLENVKLYWGLDEEVKERTAELQIEKDKVSAITNSLTDGIIMIDPEGRIIFLNPRAEEILWIKEKEIFGKKINEESLKTVSKKLNLQNLFQILASKEKRQEINITKPLQLVLQVTTIPVLGPAKKELGIMKIIHDISREKEIEKLKSEFISIAAHQLRTPLSGIKWALKMLVDDEVGKITKKQKQLLSKTYKVNDRLINLIGDLLDVTRIEEGKFGFEFKNTSLEQTFEKIIPAFSNLSSRKNLKFTYNISKDLPLVRIDPNRVSLVIENILSNAINYTVNGEINITVGYDPPKRSILISVKDTGIGIPKNEQKRVFTKFFRSSNAIRLHTEGTGLGLFIAKNITMAHHGKIWFESQENKGTTFYVIIPLEKR